MAPPPDGSAPLRSRPACPICEGQMELVYDRFNQQVFVCVECHSGITIPITAWEIQRIKRSRKP